MTTPTRAQPSAAGPIPWRRHVAGAARPVPATVALTGIGTGWRPSPVLSEWLTWWITGLDDADRVHLALRYASRYRGSLGTPAQEQQRRWLLSDWLVRTCTPRWLHEAHLHHHGDALADLAPLRRRSDLHAAARLIHAARRAAQVQHHTVRGLVLDGGAGTGTDADGHAAALTAAVDTHVQPQIRGAIQAGLPANNLWQLLSDAITDAATAVAWRALASAHPVALHVDPEEEAARALRRPAVDLRASMHHLMDRLLAITESAQTDERHR
jgi:hypothetical protein